jgi:hypothetical protein
MDGMIMFLFLSPLVMLLVSLVVYYSPYLHPRRFDIDHIGMLFSLHVHGDKFFDRVSKHSSRFLPTCEDKKRFKG